MLSALLFLRQPKEAPVDPGPKRDRWAAVTVDRAEFSMFPARPGDWARVGPAQRLDPDVEATLSADDYYLADFAIPGSSLSVDVFMAWYDDQSRHGIHPPEICLPASGWELAWLERSDVSAQMGTETPFNINRLIIQKGKQRMLVYYWFQQKGRSIAWDFAAKFWLVIDGATTGRKDGALVRLTTAIARGESDEDAEARLQSILGEMLEPLPRYVPTDS